MPNFSEQVGIPVRGFDDVAKLLPEAIIVDLIGYIQPPTVGALLDPVAGNTENIIPDGRIGSIQLGQAFMIPPSEVILRLSRGVGIQGIFLNVKPVFIRGMVSVLQHISEGEKTPS